MATERRKKPIFKILTAGELITLIAMGAGGIYAVSKFEFGLEDVKASVIRTNEKHLEDVNEIKREYREDARENKENMKEIRGLLRQILRNK